MQAWTPRLRHCLRRPPLRRAITTNSHERVEVRCGSAGHVTIDLFNLSKFSEGAPLLLHLPPFSPDEGSEIPKMPEFLHSRPVASINYRWKYTESLPSLQWPNPCHDVGFAFAWLRENLMPPEPARRGVYVYGSYLGASLAASIALTESSPSERFGVRGLAAYNGVYNWTMLLAGHPIRKRIDGYQHIVTEGQHLHELGLVMDDLFDQPSHMFDPFASASLFFHNPGMHMPDRFDEVASPVSDTVSMLIGSSDSESSTSTPKPPRKSRLVFPPRHSTLKIPRTLLLHDSPARIKGKRLSKKPQGHSFFAQANELAEYMRRSINKVEFGERIKWDDNIDSWEAGARERVQLVQLGQERNTKELCDEGASKVLEWLKKQA